jgi:hypothetical protein
MGIHAAPSSVIARFETPRPGVRQTPSGMSGALTRPLDEEEQDQQGGRADEFQ